MFNNWCAYQNLIAKGVFLYCLTITTVCQAQITSDETLSTEVTTLDNQEFTITGGRRAGGNLFHSFSEFSVPTGGAATFNNVSEIQNIISRVTGSFPSSIDGFIKAGGNANLFIINPNGIIFGSNAQLEIRGSFLASTADRIQFADGSSLSANAPLTTPTLSISAPIGLQYGENRSKTSDRSISVVNSIFGLQVQAGKTLALVGQDIFIPGGALSAPEGRIELGSVSDNSLVSLTPVDTNSVDKGWVLAYDGVQTFRDIQLSDQAFVASHQFFVETGSNSGAIQLQSRRLTLTGGANLIGENRGLNPGGTITVKASESIQVSGSLSIIANDTFSNAKGGNINLETKQLLVRDGGKIQAFTATGSSGEGGKLTIVAPESVEINGGASSELTGLLTQTASTENAGTLQITTGKLILNRGGRISTSTIGTGNGGNLLVDATELVEVSGQSVNGKSESGIFAQSIAKATGNGGNLEINTGQLIVQDGGKISVSAIDNSTGRGGNLSITAPQLVEVAGTGTNPSTLASESQGSGSAGNLTIQTNTLNVRDGAEINVSSSGRGDAGNLEIYASNVSLDNEGKLIATSNAGRGGGNITIQKANSLLLRNNSLISATANGDGNGGNIMIATDLLTALENSDITANAIRGRGGNIRIKTQGLFLSPDSKITATSERGVDGVVEIDRLENDPENALLTLPAEPVNISGLIAQGCSSGAGSIARRGSEFVITGRGGLPPTPTEAFRGDVALVDLGKPIQAEATQAKVVAPTNNQNHPESTELVEAQGWVIGSDGEVILTASAPNVTPSIPWMKSNSCHG